jgi:hypothetical protein
MVVLLFVCWCMAVPKSFAALLVFKSLCGVANTDYVFTIYGIGRWEHLACALDG